MSSRVNIMDPPPSLEPQTKTSYILRVLSTHIYAPLWLLRFHENFRQQLMVLWGQFKQKFAPALPASADNALNRLIMISNDYSNKNETPHLTDELIRIVLDDADHCTNLLECRDQEAQCLLHLFQSRLDAGSTILHRPTLRIMIRKLAVASKLYPQSYRLEGVVVFKGAEYSGGCANVHKGKWNHQSIGAKFVRIYETNRATHSETVMSEALLWWQCRHRNILPFHGIHQVDNQIYLISPWMRNGNISEYLQCNQISNRFHLAVDIAQGLNYLHENGIVHRDLKGRNILVDEEYRAVIADLGSSFAVDDAPPLPSLSCGGTVRWQAPEIFESGSSESLPGSESQPLVHASKLKASDVYAFGMVCSEIYTGQVPFAGFRSDLAIKMRILDGKRPERPVASSDSWSKWGLTEDIWSLMEACWQQKPEERPTIREVLDRLLELQHTAS